MVEYKPARALRSSCERRLEPSTVPGTLQNSVAMLLNSLPQDIKYCTELEVFDSKCRNQVLPTYPVHTLCLMPVLLSYARIYIINKFYIINITQFYI